MSTVCDLRAFPGLLANLREDKSWSQSRLGVEAGYDHSYICKLESGKRKPSRETVAALAETLGLDADNTGRLHVAAGFLPPGRWVLVEGWCIQPEQEARHGHD